MNSIKCLIFIVIPQVKTKMREKDQTRKENMKTDKSKGKTH